MKRIATFITIVILFVLSVVIMKSNATDQAASVDREVKNIVVEIDYGTVRPSQTIEIPWVKDRTALETLQTIATVETHPVGSYVIVTSIDGVEGKRGDMAWYYTVDGKSADKVAYSNVLNDANHIKWAYKKDVCSEKVDK